MTTLSNTPWIVPNVTYSLDYTKTTQATAQTVVSFQTPNYPLRLQLFAFAYGSTVPDNWLVSIQVDRVPFMYPTGTSQFNAPPLVYTICGNVPTDYMDLPANTKITVLAFMNGDATADDVLQLTMSGKEIKEP